MLQHPTQGNPFAAFGERYPAMSEWEITANDQAKYLGIFQSCSPVAGLIGGDVAKVARRVHAHATSQSPAGRAGQVAAAI